MKKYRVFALLGMLALTAGSLQAQDYDDIYYDASKSVTAETKTKTKVVKPTKTIAVYGEVPDKYQVAARDNYRVIRDEDEYNRRGAYEPQYEIDINGDTVYCDSLYEDDAFANTRRIERFYNPDIVILSDDDDLVELYYDESPTINLIVGSDYGYGWASSYYPWYTGLYEPWYMGYGWYSPWRWHSPWYYGYYNPWHWGWGWTYYSPWYYSYWRSPYWGHHYGWSNWGWHNSYANWNKPHRPGGSHFSGNSWLKHRTGLADNRNGRGRVNAVGSNRNGISARGGNGNRSTGVGTTPNRNRSGYATSRGGGNMGSRNSAGVTPRSSGAVSRSSSSGSRSYSSGGTRSSSSGSYSGGSRSYSGGRSSGSYSSGSSHSSGSYSSGGSHGSSGGGGGSHGGSSGGSRRH